MGDTILIAEDDNHTADLLTRYFRWAGYVAIRARDGREALALVQRAPPSLLVLDLMMPGVDGWQVCEQLRRGSQIPILILSARQEEADRLLGLSLGADDYVVKPFSPREVVARAQAILRRVNGTADLPARCREHRGLRIRPERHQVTLDGQAVELTPSEFTLLDALMSCSGCVLSRAELLSHLYPRGEAVVDRVVDVHVGKLRQKIESNGRRFIHTVRGIGYRFE
jgi:DNA-binding response OmpR family regulator